MHSDMMLQNQKVETSPKQATEAALRGIHETVVHKYYRNVKDTHFIQAAILAKQFGLTKEEKRNAGMRAYGKDVAHGHYWSAAIISKYFRLTENEKRTLEQNAYKSLLFHDRAASAEDVAKHFGFTDQETRAAAIKAYGEVLFSEGPVSRLSKQTMHTASNIADTFNLTELEQSDSVIVAYKETIRG